MALDQGSKAVPGIPLGALDAITDANVRDVLRALISTHHVRNNQAGSGAESFITIRQSLQLAATVTPADTGTPTVAAGYVRGVGDASVYGGGVFSSARGTLAVNLAAASSFVATLVWQALPGPGGDYDSRAELRLDGAAVFEAGNSGRAGKTMSFIATVGLNLGAGSHVFTLHFANGSHGGFVLGPWALLLLPMGA